MIIVISPSKTQNLKLISNTKNDNKNFANETTIINNELKKKIDDKKFDEWLEIKNEKLHSLVVNNIINFAKNNSYKAISFYDGLQFKNINYDGLCLKYQNLINDKLIILSAYYGLVKPTDFIKPYRLMMGSKVLIENKSLYDFWFSKINKALKKLNNDNVILNLASNEYSKILDHNLFNIINIDFKIEKENNKYVSISTFSKQCRGNFIKEFSMLNFDFEKIFDLDILGFKYNKSLSNKNNIIYTKKLISF